MIDQIKKIASKHLAETIKSRRFLHQNPELSFKEYNTSEYIQSILTKNKIPFTNGHVETGIIATIEGENPMDHEVLLRADMDALPILEENKVDYCSINKGKMHACGHDVHSASLIGTALILNELKSNFNGTIKLVFQPGEEKIRGSGCEEARERAAGDRGRPPAAARRSVPSCLPGALPWCLSPQMCLPRA